MGVPAVSIVGTTFLPLAHTYARIEGMPDLRVAEYPGAIDLHSEDEIRENIEKLVLGRIIEGLTKPTGGSGERQTAVNARDPEDIDFMGTYEEVNEFFQRRGWTDGLPIVSPTPEKVAEFLQYTDRSPQEEVAILMPGKRRATVWKIAVNGVMSGCRPEYMPILIAAVEAMGDPRYNLEQFGSTVMVLPYLLINGPVGRQLGIDHGEELISGKPNKVIGRAIGLITRNIAYLRPGEMNKGTFGYPLPFVLAEDEEGSPWEPLHVTRGFDENTSTVTMAATFSWGEQTTAPGDDVDMILDKIAWDQRNRLHVWTANFGKMAIVMQLLTAAQAKAIAVANYSKRDVEESLWKRKRMTRGELDWLMLSEAGRGSQVSSVALQIESGLIAPEYAELYDVAPDEEVPGVVSPDLIHIFVCGDPGRDKAMTLAGTYPELVTREIRLPVEWNELMEKQGYPAIESVYK